MKCSLNKFYRSIDTSKQAFHVKYNRYKQRQEELGYLHLIVNEVRKDHPGMSLRDLYHMIQPTNLGRDRFECYFSELGYGVSLRRSRRRTTDSTGVIRFPNLIAHKKLTGVNQVWVSDITYYRIGEKFYYLTFIMDLYSRRIVGHSISRTLLTNHTTIKALQGALTTRGLRQIEGLILHSDGGGQYYSHEFRELTRKAKIVNSMGKSVYENPHAERVNGIIKNNYVRHYAPETFNQLIPMTNKAVRMYNQEKPHKALNKLSPIQFESKLFKCSKPVKKQKIKFEKRLLTV